MDILTHSLSGIAVGTVISSFCSHRKEKILVTLLGGLGGILPDIDAISLWSKFDKTFGSLFQLAHSGRHIYSAKLWYSHHAFMHSILAAFLLGLLISFICKKLFYRRNLSPTSKKQNIHFLTFFSFVGGFCMHLLEDMPTPSSAWGGVNLLFPSDEYIGGWGKIWWWNNYDIFLIVISIILFNIITHFIFRLSPIIIRYITILILVGGFSLATYQINHRNFDFSYAKDASKYPLFEQRSKEIQREILGNKGYQLMYYLDQKIPFYF